MKIELARVKLDVPTFEAITNAGDVRLDLCGSEMLLTKRQTAAGKKLLTAYQERLTTREREQTEARASAATSATSADPATTETPSASEPASAEVPETTADAPTAPTTEVPAPVR